MTYVRAEIKWSDKYPDLKGVVLLGQKPDGIMVTAEGWGLPTENGTCKNGNFFLSHS